MKKPAWRPMMSQSRLNTSSPAHARGVAPSKTRTVIATSFRMRFMAHFLLRLRRNSPAPPTPSPPRPAAPGLLRSLRPPPWDREVGPHGIGAVVTVGPVATAARMRAGAPRTRPPSASRQRAMAFVGVARPAQGHGVPREDVLVHDEGDRHGAR